MATVGWWASDTPLHLATGYRFRSAPWRRKTVTVSTDHRLRHLYCVGSSGSGKSRLARHLLYQDIDANRGFTLVDPHGDLAKEVLGYIADLALGTGKPTAQGIAELGDKLVIIEPSDQRFGVPGINLLQVAPGQVGYQLVDGIIEIIREIWPDTFGPRLEDICRNALLLLQELQLTVLEIIPLLSDTRFRDTLVQQSHSADTKLYFEQHLGGLRPAELKTWVESSRNKWSAFLSNPFIRPILGQNRSTIDFQDIMDNGKWLIVNISRDKLKESRRLLGALIVALMHNAAVGRESRRMDERVFHSLVVDEFEEFWTPTFLHILEGARKYGLALSMFHQNLSQPPFDANPAIVDTIIANTHTRIAFSLSRKDAMRVAGEFFFPSGKGIRFQETFLGIPQEQPKCWSISDEREGYAAELMKQRPAEAFVSFKGLGDDEPYVAQVPPVADVVPDLHKIDILRQHVASRYYRRIPDVEREIRERWARIQAAAVPVRQIGRDYTQ